MVNIVNVGTAPNAGNGDNLRNAFEKINARFLQFEGNVDLNQRFQGAAAADPTVRLAGGALQNGDWYLNTTSNKYKIRIGGAWTIAPDIVAADFAAPDGGVNVGFQRPEAGAVLRNAQAKLLEMPASLADFDGAQDGVIDDTVAVRNAALASPQLRLTGAVKAPGLTMGDVAEVLFRGPGTIVGPVRRAVIPDLAPSDNLFSMDLVAERHCKQINSIRTTPVVCLLGDSISTWFANSIGRGDMLASVLESTLRNQFGGVTFWNRAIGGMTLGGLLAPIPSLYNVDWNVTLTKPWLTYVQDLAPDLVFLSFGMNDGNSLSAAALTSVVDMIRGWAKVPDIVILTNLVPSMSDSVYQEGAAGQDSRDAGAGWLRTYAKFRNVGLIDIHRKCCMVRDGFDPVSTALKAGGSVTATVLNPSVNTAVGTQACRAYKARIFMNASAWGVGDYITVRTGSGNYDYLQIIKVDSTHLRMVMVGGTDSDNITYANEVVVAPVPYTTTDPLTVEIYGNHVSVYIDALANYGSYSDPIYTRKIIAKGAAYVPQVTTTGGVKLTSVDYYYGQSRQNVPTLTNSDLWGSPTQQPYGGSVWNHPSSKVATLIYRPMIEAVRFVSKLPEQRGTFAAGPGTSNLSFVFPTPEPDLDFSIGIEITGNPGGWHWISVKSVNGFTLAFSAATPIAVGVRWWVIRP